MHAADREGDDTLDLPLRAEVFFKKPDFLRQKDRSPIGA
jgi:hypothetical protein